MGARNIENFRARFIRPEFVSADAVRQTEGDSKAPIPDMRNERLVRGVLNDEALALSLMFLKTTDHAPSPQTFLRDYANHSIFLGGTTHAISSDISLTFSRSPIKSSKHCNCCSGKTRRPSDLSQSPHTVRGNGNVNVSDISECVESRTSLRPSTV